MYKLKIVYVLVIMALFMNLLRCRGNAEDIQNGDALLMSGALLMDQNSGGGNGDASEQNEEDTSSSAIEGSAPVNVDVVAGDASATLNWDGGDGFDKYYIYYSTISGVSRDEYDGNSSVVSGDTKTTITGLANGYKYYFVVYGYNETDKIWSESSTEVSGTPEAFATLQPKAVYATHNDVIHAENVFVAVGNSILTSPDGKIWEIRTNPCGSGDYMAIDHNGTNMFAAVSRSGDVAYSIDGGNTWNCSTQLKLTDYHYEDIAYGNNQWMVVGDTYDGGHKAFLRVSQNASIDGTETWNGFEYAGHYQYTGVLYDNISGKYYIVDYSSGMGHCGSSCENPASWTMNEIGYGETIESIGYGNGMFILGSYNNLFTSTSWAYNMFDQIKMEDCETISEIIFHNHQFIVVSDNFILRSGDGYHWKQNELYHSYLNGVACDATACVAVGSGGSIYRFDPDR